MEDKLGEQTQLKNELKLSKAENEGFRIQIEKINEQHQAEISKYKEVENDNNKKLEEEKTKSLTLTQELQRVKSRQLVFSKNQGGATGGQIPLSPSRTSAVQPNLVEVKRLNDELGQANAEKDRLESQVADFKKIASESEKRMNETMESQTKLMLLKDKEVETAKKSAVELQEKISVLEKEIKNVKSQEGSGDIKQLHTKVTTLQLELSTMKEVCETKDQENMSLRQNYQDSIIQHGKAAEEVQKWRTEAQEKDRKLGEERQNLIVQKARSLGDQDKISFKIFRDFQN